MTDPYQVLGVSPSATDEEIKKAYRQLCKQYHPDLHAGQPDEKQAEKRFVEIQQAYQQVMRMRQGGQDAGGAYAERERDPYADFWGMGYGPGYGGYDYGRQQEEDVSSGMRAAKVYIDAGHYAEALNALNGVPMGERNARWYFLNALAQCGLRNIAQATQYARQAVTMEPGNIQYQQLLSELQNGGMRYTQQGQRYGRGVFGMSDPRCMCLAANLLCLCMGGGGMCWYPVLCCI